ncbi:hypothetical protein [Actinomadura madurae]|uniref:hypothetical protein n=1 Tax=Actinomadura madurae TaxID=1993 RepID=UPI000D946629|nr:hypothetical protein [Actinomadura madurae]SPT57125.1 Uncharacterised protein [Actinomadura madurae]
MTVTDKQVATLTAQLAGRHEEYKRLYAELDPEEVGFGYSALVGAAAAIAIDRRFAKDNEVAGDAEVIDFVGDLRSRDIATAETLDPAIAEQLILHNLGKGDISNFDSKALFSTQIIILAGLIADEKLSETELTAFIEKARRVAETWTADAS